MAGLLDQIAANIGNDLKKEIDLKIDKINKRLDKIDNKLDKILKHVVK